MRMYQVSWVGDDKKIHCEHFTGREAAIVFLNHIFLDKGFWTARLQTVNVAFNSPRLK